MTHIDAGPLMSQAVVHGDQVILSGQVAIGGPDAPFADQAHEIFARIDALLDKAGTHRGRMIAATIWITDLAHFAAFNDLWICWLNGAPAPARATVRADLVLPGLLLEIQVSAAL